MVTALVVNENPAIYVDVENENRETKRYPVLMFAAVFDPKTNNAVLMPVSIVDGRLQCGGKQLVVTDA